MRVPLGLTRWQEMMAAAEVAVNEINKLNIGYPVSGVFSTSRSMGMSNSNSVISTLAIAMGLEPPLSITLAIPGWNVILLDRQTLLKARAQWDNMPAPSRQCFSSGTPVLASDGRPLAIEAVKVGARVSAYTPDFLAGQGSLIPCRVTRLFRNITTEWLILSCGLTVTPGHHFLNEHGGFERIDALVSRGGMIVREDGSCERVTAERIVYSEATRHLYEEAEEIVYASAGGAALKPEVRRGWRTYNFEVEDLHTYIAGGVRVHNQSLQDYLALSAMMKNNSYVAVAYGDIATRWGPAAAATAAWSGEPFMSANFDKHVGAMVEAHAQALALGDTKLAEAIRGGLENLAATGAKMAQDDAQRALDDNPNSSVASEMRDRRDTAKAAYEIHLARNSEMHDAEKRNGASPSSSADVPDVRGNGEPAARQSKSDTPARAPAKPSPSDAAAAFKPLPNNPAPSASAHSGEPTITEFPDGTKLSQTESLGKKTFSVVKGKDVLELGETVKQTNGTSREEIVTALPKGGVQKQVATYAEDGTMIAQTITVREMLRSAYRLDDKGTRLLWEYTDTGLLAYQLVARKNGSGYSWQYDFNLRKRDWHSKKTYFDKKGALTHHLLTLDKGVTEVESFAKNHKLAFFVNRLTLVGDALNGTGNARSNKMIGNAHDNVMRGNGGGDTLQGGSGNDVLSGDDGNDVLLGEADRDVLRGGNGDDALYGGDGADALFGDAGADILSGGTGNDTLVGGEGDDRLSGEGWDDTLQGDAGNDTLLGGEGYDRLYGGAGNDLIEGDAQGDMLDGGEGDDTLLGGSEVDELYGGGGRDMLDGGAGFDRLYGDAGNDSLAGGEGSDELFGGEGDDTLKGGTGHDLLAGGAGADLLTGGAGRDALHGGEGSDRLEGEEEDDTLEGGSGDDTLVGGEGSDRLRGGDGDDTLQGEAGRDDLDGGNGNDVIRGGADNDALLGSGGDDTLYGGIGSDGLVGDDGNDMLDGEAGNDMLKGGAGADLLFGDSGADTLYGGLGADSLRGGAGADQLYGDADDDDLDGGESDDKLWGGDGKDILVGGAGNDVLSGDAGDDTLAGGLGDDMLAGGAGDDSLSGGGGHDQLFGGAGNDRLMGGPDVDHIDGGEGTDTVVLGGAHADYKIRFNEAVGRFSIVDLRAGSPDGTDLAAIELFEFSDGTLTKANSTM